MKLFIVESPAKINKICSILGKSYKGLASYGHIMDLHSKKMSIDFEDNFNPIYVITEDKHKVVKNLIEEAQSASEILLATDKDREGEMISWNIAQVLKLKEPKRIVFTSLTKAALQSAIKNATTINYNMVDSQKARRVLDRIVGYELSPLIDKFLDSHKLSAGRVQSVVCRLIVDRENEINKFLSNKNLSSYFVFNGIFTIKQHQQEESLKAQLHTIKLVKAKIPTKEESTVLLTTMTTSKYHIKDIFSKKRTQSSSQPYTTSTLQQDSSTKLGFSGKRTMMTAQNLYEAGLITYMRTDSIILSPEALTSIEKYIKENYDIKYYKKTIYKANENAQEAHECIRPTDVFTTNLEPNGKIQSDEIKLYNLIWKRTVATQMSPAEFNDLNIHISIDKLNDYLFCTCIASLVFNGYLILYGKGIDTPTNDDPNSDDEKQDTTNDKFDVKLLKKGTEIQPTTITAHEEYVKPPSRYTEASLINKLDTKNLNIGRPATLVPIVTKIIEKQYIKIADNPGKIVDTCTLIWNYNNPIKEENKQITLCKETKRFTPTKLGILITNYLLVHFPKIIDYHFTSLLEEKLDQIAEGKLVWHQVIKEFYDEFHPLVMNIVNLNNIKSNNNKHLGSYKDKDVYIGETRYGPTVKYVVDKSVKFFSINEPLTLENITLDDAISLIQNNINYPKLLGNYKRKQVVLKKYKDTFYIAHDKKTYSATENFTLEEAIKIIDSRGPISELKDATKICEVLRGKDNIYMKITNIKTKKSYNVPMPYGEDLDKLTMTRVNQIVKNKFDSNKQKFESNKK